MGGLVIGVGPGAKKSSLPCGRAVRPGSLGSLPEEGLSQGEQVRLSGAARGQLTKSRHPSPSPWGKTTSGEDGPGQRSSEGALLVGTHCAFQIGAGVLLAPPGRKALGPNS